MEDPIERCDREIVEMLALVMVDENWLLGYMDWCAEKRLLLGQKVFNGNPIHK